MSAHRISRLVPVTPAASALLGLWFASSFVAPARAQEPVEPEPVPSVCLQDCTAVPNPAHPYQFDRAWGGRIWGAHHWYDSVHDSHTLWIGEDGGRIRRSDDGGATWVEQETPREMRGQVHGIYFLDDGRTGWAVSGFKGQFVSEGHLIGTLDGGNCWTYIQGFDEVLFDVHFVDEWVGFIAGDELLMGSDDGGCSWRDEAFDPTLPSPVPSTFEPDESEFYALDVLSTPNDFVALVSAEPGVVLRRTGANALWSVVLYVDPSCPDDNYPAGITLDPPCNACAPEPCDGTADCAPLEMWGVSLSPDGDVDTAVAYATGGIGNGYGAIFRGTDGGTAWTRENHECYFSTTCGPSTTACASPLDCDVEGYSSFAAVYGIHAIDDENAIACAYGGAMYQRSPGSTPSWTDRTSRCNFGTAPLQTVVGDALGNAWIFGFFGAVRSTTDGGSTWTEYSGGQTWRLRDVEFIDSSNGWVVGQQNRIAYTDDGGATWSVQREEPRCPTGPNAGRSLQAIAMGDSVNGVAVGQTMCPSGCPHASEEQCTAPGPCGTTIYVDCCNNASAPSSCFPRPPLVLFTTDGGATWDPPSSLDSAANDKNLLDVACSGNNGTSNEYWAVGGASVVVHSADGGDTWSAVSFPVSATLGSVVFKTLDTGFVVGWTGTNTPLAYRITNATTSPTWTDLSPTASGLGKLNDVTFYGPNVFAVGNRATGAPGEKGTVVAWRASFSTFVPQTAAQDLAVDADLLSIAVVPSGSAVQVFVGGIDGKMLWSSNGSTWAVGDSEMGDNIRSLSFTSASFGFAVGFSDGLLSHGGSGMARYEP